MSKKYDHVIIDAGGRDTTSQRAALSVSHALLIPCKPRSFDLWAIENVAQLVEEVRMINPEIKASVFLNQTDPAGQGSEMQGHTKAGKTTRLQLRLPNDILRRIDAMHPEGITAPSRHDWFLDAMIERLERDEGQG